MQRLGQCPSLNFSEVDSNVSWIGPENADLDPSLDVEGFLGMEMNIYSFWRRDRLGYMERYTWATPSQLGHRRNQTVEHHR